MSALALLIACERERVAPQAVELFEDARDARYALFARYLVRTGRMSDFPGDEAVVERSASLGRLPYVERVEQRMRLAASLAR